jgi:hypothetical protein
MEKKKLLEAVSKNSRPKEDLILSGIFMKVKGDPSSSRLVELYERQLLYYTVNSTLIAEHREERPLQAYCI